MNSRAQIFLLIFALFSVLEVCFQKLPSRNWRSKRKYANLMLAGIFQILLKALPVTWLIMSSEYLGQLGSLGALNLFKLDWAIKSLLGIFFLDFWIYLQHKLFHRIAFLWRFHKVHHADFFLDTTSALRFHPIEILISSFFKIFGVVIMGIELKTLVLFEIILNGMAIFNHSNLLIHPRLEKWLSKFVVTPDFHRIHHLNSATFTNSHYGFCLTVWDHLFNSLTNASSIDKGQLSVGLIEPVSTKDSESLKWMLWAPFKNS